MYHEHPNIAYSHEGQYPLSSERCYILAITVETHIVVIPELMQTYVQYYSRSLCVSDDLMPVPFPQMPFPSQPLQHPMRVLGVEQVVGDNRLFSSPNV